MDAQGLAITIRPARNDQATYIVEPTATHSHTIILLHGLGSNGEKFGRELLETGTTSGGRTLPQLLPSARFIFPTSKRRRSSAFKRALITQWFDIARLPDPAYRQETQLQGLAESVVELSELLRVEMVSISPENIILGGISQGCAMALSFLLALDHPLGGYIGMCGYLPFQKDIEDAVSDESKAEIDEDDPFASEDGDIDPHADQQLSLADPAVKAQAFERDLLCLPPLLSRVKETTACSTPVYLGHGDADEKKPYALGEAAARTMRTAGYEVAWKLYPGLGHWYQIPDQIDDIVEFIRGPVGWRLSDEERGHGP
ncbi:hypothetical protein DL766_005551 [Monosporascus sp. MC13-8B]|uniref:Acyl-protein thioesterase 1 n=1 Tax=Monosporascus cannonballus TaxID=155416 RepID=A0ABY0H3C3_9PEZI|nr:hypothetical protein DL762_006331 [Monosporascus cannonballus]RYO83576.1 hypothetical protein DL763_007833 [Monosporascus cannonballus]RYP29106.1 hypothetical protein DL766_005551 [Monosporascus sp. MC13-8B]